MHESNDTEMNITHDGVEKVTAYERIKRLFQKDRITGTHDPRLYFVSQCVGAGSIAGFVIGGRIGAHVAGMEHVESNQLTVYKSKTHAQRQYHANVSVGFVRNGCKFGWRAGAFAGIYSFLIVALSEVREKKDGMNYLGAGALTGTLYKSLSGYRHMAVGAILGSALSFPFATLIHLLNTYSSEETRQKFDIFGGSFVSPEYQQMSSLSSKEESNLMVTDALVSALEKEVEIIDGINEDMFSLLPEEGITSLQQVILLQKSGSEKTADAP